MSEQIQNIEINDFLLLARGWKKGHRVQWTEEVTKTYKWGWTAPGVLCGNHENLLPNYVKNPKDNLDLLQWMVSQDYVYSRGFGLYNSINTFYCDVWKKGTAKRFTGYADTETEATAIAIARVLAEGAFISVSNPTKGSRRSICDICKGDIHYDGMAWWHTQELLSHAAVPSPLEHIQVFLKDQKPSEIEVSLEIMSLMSCHSGGDPGKNLTPQTEVTDSDVDVF